MARLIKIGVFFLNLDNVQRIHFYQDDDEELCMLEFVGSESPPEMGDDKPTDRPFRSRRAIAPRIASKPDDSLPPVEPVRHFLEGDEAKALKKFLDGAEFVSVVL